MNVPARWNSNGRWHRQVGSGMFNQVGLGQSVVEVDRVGGSCEFAEGGCRGEAERVGGVPGGFSSR